MGHIGWIRGLAGRWALIMIEPKFGLVKRFDLESLSWMLVLLLLQMDIT